MRTLGLMAAILIGSFVQAQESFEDNEVSVKQGHVAVGLGLHSMNYAEEVPLPFKSTETGVIRGVHATTRIRISSKATMDVSGSFGTGDTKYDGSLQDGTPATGVTKNSILNLELLFGSELDQGLEGYAGVGYRAWDRDLRGMRGGYLEEYRMIFLPIGIRGQVHLSGSLSLEPDVSLRYLAGGVVNAHIGEILDLPLGRRIGARMALPLVLGSRQSGGVVVTPWYEVTGIGDGPPKVVRAGRSLYQYHEPASLNHQFGLSLAATF